jgi:hypothetical protein
MVVKMTVTQIKLEQNNIKIFQLSEDDAYALLHLVQTKAIHTCARNDYWKNLARKIFLDLEAQKDGLFFQCAACTCQEEK